MKYYIKLILNNTKYSYFREIREIRIFHYSFKSLFQLAVSQDCKLSY